MSATLGQVADLVRSKNAGPFWLTIDIFLATDDDYDRVTRSPAARPDVIGPIYQVDPDLVRVFLLPTLRVIKLSFPRPVVQGALADRDMHAGQQFVPLLGIEVA